MGGNMGVIKSIFKPRDKPKNHTGDSIGGGRSFPFGRTWSGKSVTERSAMQTTAVYACVRIISETVASLPIHLYEYTDSGKERAFTHPLYRLLHDIPNPEMNSFIMREVMMSHLLLWGNSYSQIIRNGKGEVTALYPLMPEKMRIDRGADTKIYYTYNSDKQGTFVFRKDEILHIVGLGFDGLVGYSPIAMAKNAIGLSIAAEEYGSSFFSNSGTPSGVLEHPGVLKEPEKVRDAWNDAYGGSSNAHKVAVLEEGMKFNPISINPHEAQFLETRKFQVNEICRIFRVPPHMIADLEKSSFNNIEQQSLDFVTNTIRPWLVRIEQTIFQQLLTEEEQKIVKERQREKLKEMTFYATTDDCLRAYMLRYFGEKAKGKCDNCSNCKGEYDTYDVTRIARSVIRCINDLEERYGTTAICEVLTGLETDRVIRNGLDDEISFGLLYDVEISEIRNVINYLVREEYITQTDGKYPILTLNHKAREFMKKDVKVNVKVRKKNTVKPKFVREKTADSNLFELLRQCRMKIAQQKRVPAFMIFTDASLRDMTVKQPTTEREFLTVSGVGSAKMKAYGKEFMNVIKQYKKR